MAARFYVPLPDRALVSVAGEDARQLLQGLVSNDANRVAPNRAIYAALLTPQGKYQFDFFVFERDGTLYLECEAARRDALIKRLSIFKLRARVSLVPFGDHVVYAAFGEGSLAALGLEPVEGAARSFAGGTIYTDPRLAAAGARAALPAGDGARALTEAGFQAVPFDAYDSHRIGIGLPDGSRDMVVERSMPRENGLEELNGVDFAKGCFIGQEVTTRMKRRGLVRKRLMKVAIEGPIPEPGTKVMWGGIEAGEMRTSSNGLGLALLRLDVVDRMADNPGALIAGEAQLTPCPPPRP